MTPILQNILDMVSEDTEDVRIQEYTHNNWMNWILTLPSSCPVVTNGDNHSTTSINTEVQLPWFPTAAVVAMGKCLVD